MFDAMHCKEFFEYSRSSDRIIGVEYIEADTRSGQYGQSLLTFMIRSVFGGWTQIIGHHFTRSSFPRQELKLLLHKYLAALHSANMECVAIVCDQEASHMSMFKEVGVCPQTPYFRCPYSDQQIVVIWDPPHLLKNARNNLMTNDFVCPNEKVSSWADVKDLFSLEKTKTLRRAPQLTNDHIHPTLGRKMKVSLAAQVFSRRTATALSSYEDELSGTASNTAETFKTFNDIFDFMNSSSLTDCGSNRPALRQLWDTQMKDIERWIQLVSSIRFRNKRTNRIKSTLPFKEGWLMSLRAVSILISNLFTRDGISFVLTRRLNQDPIEHLFSAVRGKGGFNDHPTVRQAAAAIRVLSANAYLRKGMTNHSNVEEEESEHLPPSLANTADQRVFVPSTEDVPINTSTLSISFLPHDVDIDKEDEDSLDTESGEIKKFCDRETMSYVIGSILRRLGCESCCIELAQLKSKEESEGFLSLMTYEQGRLYEPSRIVTDSFLRVLPRFVTFLRGHFFELNIAEKSVSYLELFLQELSFCNEEHKRSFLYLFAALLLRTFCKEKNEEPKSSKKHNTCGSKFRRLNV